MRKTKKTALKGFEIKKCLARNLVIRFNQASQLIRLYLSRLQKENIFALMKISYYCPYWGSEDLSYTVFCKKAKEYGYDGIEISFPLEDLKSKEEILSAVERHKLKLLAQHWQTLDKDFTIHKENLLSHLHYLKDTTTPYINSHTGRDYFSFEQNYELIQLVQAFSRETGMSVIHETHRGRFNFHAATAAKYLEHDPDIRFNLDISHWFNVSESLLEDQEEIIDLTVEHTDHIHARVGYQQGPQVPDPRVPEWQETVERHLNIWQKVIDAKKNKGATHFGITSEFGPYPYLVHHPFTQTPIASQWDINVYMMNYLRKNLK